MAEPNTLETHAPDAPPVEQTVEQRDKEWLETVYKGDSTPQLTARAIIAGMLFGGLMSLSNLYIGLKSGWGLGVDIAAVIIIYSVFKGLKGVGIVKKEFGMMESTIMMTVAVAASWISSAGLVSAVPALTMLTGYTFVWWQLTIMIGVILYLGLFVAIPFKRQMIQVDNLRFPAAIPTGETIKAMYSAGGEAMKKAKALGMAGGIGVLIAVLRDGVAPRVAAIGSFIKAEYAFPTMIGKIPLSKLTLTFEPSLIFIGIGALFGMKVGLSMLFGLLLNYGVLAPNLINAKIIKHAAPQVRAEALLGTFTVTPGQEFAVVVEEANKTPELAAGSRIDTLRYKWTAPVTYSSLQQIESHLNAATLLDGRPNPLYGVVSVRDTLNKTLGGQLLFVEASKANTWESKLSIAGTNDPALLAGLGYKPDPENPGKLSNYRPVGSFRNISAWSLWPGATMLVVGGLLALAFQWRTLGKTFGNYLPQFRQEQELRVE